MRGMGIVVVPKPIWNGISSHSTRLLLWRGGRREGGVNYLSCWIPLALFCGFHGDYFAVSDLLVIEREGGNGETMCRGTSGWGWSEWPGGGRGTG